MPRAARPSTPIGDKLRFRSFIYEPFYLLGHDPALIQVGCVDFSMVIINRRPTFLFSRAGAACEIEL